MPRERPGKTLVSMAAFTLLLVAGCGGKEGAPPATATTVARMATASPVATSTRTAGPTMTTAPRTPTPTATVAAGGPSLRVDHGSRQSGMVALTFDMGGRVESALDIMDWLVANEIPATIFMTGAMAENPNTDAGRDVLAIVDAHPGLFELGNHSYSHPDFRTLSAEEMRDELARTEAAVAGYVSRPMRPLFRPPFGAVDGSVLDGVGNAGYAYTVMWDIDTLDWMPEADGGPTASGIVDKVTGSAQGGSIVLMHLGGYNTLESLPGVVSGLEAKGLRFARVTELVP